MVFVTMSLLTGLVVALETEEGVLFAPLVQANHPRLLAIYTLREVLYADITCLGTLLFFHKKYKSGTAPQTSQIYQAISSSTPNYILECLNQALIRCSWKWSSCLSLQSV